MKKRKLKKTIRKAGSAAGRIAALPGLWFQTATTRRFKREETVQDVIDSMNDKQKNVLYFLVGQALESSDEEDNEEFEMDI